MTDTITLPRATVQQVLDACTAVVFGWQALTPLAVRRAAAESLDDLRAALEQPEQEPVAWCDIEEDGTIHGLRYWSEPGRREHALYTHPPRRETEPAFDALVAISLLTHLGGEVADYEDVVEAVRRVHALNGELLEALLEERRVRLMGQEDDVHWESLRDMRRAAIAATDAAIARAEGKA
jgi:hypothetical protein